MRLRDRIKRYLPSYRIERRIKKDINGIRANIREFDKKNEYLFWLSQMKPEETMDETKRRIFEKIPKATGQLRTIQLAENYILQRVKDICDEYNLQFFLIGGTLLGAVRHKGFIPWDNDIDIGMLEKDFMMLQDILSKDEMIYAGYFYNSEVGLKIPKIKFKENDFFWIDVFLFDYIDANEKNANDIWKKTQIINAQYSTILRDISSRYIKQYPGKPIANTQIDSAILETEERLKKEFGLFGRGNYICETLNSPYWSRDPRGISKASDRFPLTKDGVEFEGKKYDVWCNYEQALEFFYGDYWSLPSSISEPHTHEFDNGLDEAIIFLQEKGILKD